LLTAVRPIDFTQTQLVYNTLYNIEVGSLEEVSAFLVKGLCASRQAEVGLLRWRCTLCRQAGGLFVRRTFYQRRM